MVYNFRSMYGWKTDENWVRTVGICGVLAHTCIQLRQGFCQDRASHKDQHFLFSDSRGRNDIFRDRWTEQDHWLYYAGVTVVCGAGVFLAEDACMRSRDQTSLIIPHNPGQLWACPWETQKSQWNLSDQAGLEMVWTLNVLTYPYTESLAEDGILLFQGSHYNLCRIII